jgi:hypothetical protein
MAQTPNNFTVKVSVDTTQLEEAFAAIGAGFAQTAEQLKPAIQGIGEAFAKTAAQLKIAQAFDVPPEVIGVDPAEIHAQAQQTDPWPGEWPYEPQAYTVGELASLADNGVLPPGECPANTTPYVPGHLGANAMLVHQFQPPAAGAWKGKTSAEIIADIKKAAAAMTKKKTFTAQDNPDSPVYGIKAHEVFTSPLIHTPGQVQEAAKQMLKAKGMKIVSLDDSDGQTPVWVDVGGIDSMSFSLEYDTEGLDALKKVQPQISQAITEAALKQQTAVETQVIGTFLGIDLGADPGYTVTAEVSPADPHGAVQISVHDADGNPVKQATLDQQTVQDALAEAYKTAPTAPIQIGQAWHQGWEKPISYHAPQGQAIDFNLPDEGVSSILGAFPEIPTETKKTPFTSHSFSTTVHLEDTGATIVSYPDGVSTVHMPGTVHAGSGMHKFDYKGTFPTDLAKVLVGLEKPKPGEGLPTVQQWAAGKPFFWHPEHGWMPEKDHQAAVSTAPPVEEDLFAEEEPPSPHLIDLLSIADEARTWCMFHAMHNLDPVHVALDGNTFECGSGTWTRQSTPLEDKQVIAKIRAMEDQGLM